MLPQLPGLPGICCFRLLAKTCDHSNSPRSNNAAATLRHTQCFLLQSQDSAEPNNIAGCLCSLCVLFFNDFFFFRDYHNVVRRTKACFIGYYRFIALVTNLMCARTGKLRSHRARACWDPRIVRRDGPSLQKNERTDFYGAYELSAVFLSRSGLLREAAWICAHLHAHGRGGKRSASAPVAGRVRGSLGRCRNGDTFRGSGCTRHFPGTSTALLVDGKGHERRTL